MSVIGKLVYLVYYKPLSRVRKVQSFGGLINYLKIIRGKRAMDRAGWELHMPITNATHEVYFLTGKKYWGLTAFCMYSLAKVSSTIFKPVFVDDGTFDADFAKQLQKQFPGCGIKLSSEIDEVLQTVLPKDKYPVINKKLTIYPHLKKLTHVHASTIGWKMVLDSDMLFFRNPVELNNWISDPQQPFFLYDPINSYHYSLSLMQNLTGSSITSNLNVGAVGLKSEDINWDHIENWIAELEKDEGANYLLEQALSAMLVSGQPITVANKTGYIVMPGKEEIGHPTATLHHYVAQSKEGYYKTAWKTIK